MSHEICLNVQVIHNHFTRFLRNDHNGLTATDLKNALYTLVRNFNETSRDYDVEQICQEAINEFGIQKPGVLAQDEFVQLLEFFAVEKGFQFNYMS